ncbi:hypothetical protein Cch01nite_13810 [Cellulomonas chitinilytica]|uniref:Peptidoglycan binding-like domain-containing protein n=2 Tax=Cellulomonas chitinilytica TaxID=398759 RepID=A0A919P1Y7_9CELL|nr:hypothetical protein Cch01nite_13810 [Cellulomonas chitinilytica]
MSTKRKYALLTLPMTAALTISCITPALADSPGALPTFTLGGLPAGGFVTHNDFTLTIAPGADDPVQRAEVFVDGAQVGHWGVPSVAFPLDDLPEGTHTVEVKAYDADDEEFVETRTFTVDTLVPDFSFTSHGLADGQTTDATHLSFTVYSEQGALTYQLDGGLWLAATDSQLLEFTDLAVGGHHLLLRSTDPAGNVIGGSFDWTVTAPGGVDEDTTAPEITGWVTKRTEGETTEYRAAGFAWHSDDDDATWYASLDGATPTRTDGRNAFYDDLAEGVHTWSVYGVDAAGNESVPFTVTWTIAFADVPEDNPAPVVTWVRTPAASSTATTATFSVSATEGSSVEYVLDLPEDAQMADPIPVEGSQFTLTGLSVGQHTIQVSAVKDGRYSEVLTYAWTVTAASVTPPAVSAPSAERADLRARATDVPADVIAAGVQRGARGEVVSLIQRVVGADTDGRFGPQTRAAIKAFQTAHGLKDDGIVGPKTWAAILAVLAGDGELAPARPAAGAIASSVVSAGINRGDRGGAVAIIQRALGVRVTATFDLRTRAAVQAFQRAHGLQADGIVGPLTWAAIVAG